MRHVPDEAASVSRRRMRAKQSLTDRADADQSRALRSRVLANCSVTGATALCGDDAPVCVMRRTAACRQTGARPTLRARGAADRGRQCWRRTRRARSRRCRTASSWSTVGARGASSRAGRSVGSTESRCRATTGDSVKFLPVRVDVLFLRLSSWRPFSFVAWRPVARRASSSIATAPTCHR